MTQNVSYHIGKTYGPIWAPVHKRSADSLYNGNSICYPKDNDDDDDDDDDGDDDDRGNILVYINRND